MNLDANKKLIDILNDHIEPISDGSNSYSSIMEKIGDARFVLIGEATHGTEEFYRTRIEITQQLIKKKGFMAVAIEGNWPNAYQIHRYVGGIENKNSPESALTEFKDFPTWMWRNTVMPPFIEWLRDYNDQIPLKNHKIGFFGLDVYSLYSSMQVVIDYLTKVDPPAALRAKSRYACFDHLKIDPQTYGYLTTAGIKRSCIKEAKEQWLDMQHSAIQYLKQDGIEAEEEYFYASQNARLVKNSEAYYRSLFEGRVTSWNIRDHHMEETLHALSDYLEKRFNKPAKIIVWAHNSHVGDARATEMSDRGEVNLGQLIRENYPNDTYLIGFSTYHGYVTAADEWGASAKHKAINPGLKSGYEELFHHLMHKNFILNLRGDNQLEHYLQIARLQRAIGVIYCPESERYSHYFFTHLPYQFDTVIHLDKTNAIQPLDLNEEWVFSEKLTMI